MKTKLFIFGIVVCIAFSSCHKDELLYSCDPQADEFVKTNLEEIQQITRSQWLELDNFAIQRAAYIAFIPNQKYNFWKDKLIEILTLSWSEKEKEHITKLLTFVENNPMLFSSDYLNDEHNLDDYDTFIYKWQDYAINVLDWDRKILYAIGSTGEKMINTQGDLIHDNIKNTSRIKTSIETGGGGDSWLSDCNCNTTDSWCDPTGEFQQACRNNSIYRCKTHANDPNKWFDGCWKIQRALTP